MSTSREQAAQRRREKRATQKQETSTGDRTMDTSRRMNRKQQKEWDNLTEWLQDHGDEVLACAYAGYSKNKTRGFVMIGWEGRSADGVPLIYVNEDGAASLEHEGTRASTLRNLKLYAPDTQAVVVAFVTKNMARTIVMGDGDGGTLEQIFSSNPEHYLGQMESWDSFEKKHLRKE